MPQSVYVYLYVLVPSQVKGLGESTIDSKTPVIVPEQLSVAVGTVGGIASAKQFTILAPFELFIKGGVESNTLTVFVVNTMLQGTGVPESEILSATIYEPHVVNVLLILIPVPSLLNVIPSYEKSHS